MKKITSFKEFYNAGAFLSNAKGPIDNQFFGVSQMPDLPLPSLELPTKQFAGKVTRINYTENPISVMLDNGRTLNMTKKQWDYLKFNNKEPKINSKMQVEMWLDGTIKSINII